MKNLNALFWECMAELHEIGFTPGEITEVTVNTRAKHRWGQARRRNGKYSINISETLLEDNVPDKIAKNTIIHEILHCHERAHGHKGFWREWANQVNFELGYNIQRCSDYSEYVQSDPVEQVERKYVIKCTSCGKEYHRARMTKVISHPEKYRCKCGGELIREV